MVKENILVVSIFDALQYSRTVTFFYCQTKAAPASSLFPIFYFILFFFCVLVCVEKSQMSVKLLLGEGLDVIRHGEVLEYETNKHLERIKSKKSKSEIAKVIQDLEMVYRTYVKGLEILNAVRHLTDSKASPSKTAGVQEDKNINELCRGKMLLYMDRCTAILDKTSNIFIPINQIAIPMTEYSAGTSIQTGLECFSLEEKNKMARFSTTLSRGTYVITLLNKDDYTILSPEVVVHVSSTPVNPSVCLLETVSTLSSPVPCGMGWRRVIGTTHGAELCIEVSSSASRQAHLSLQLHYFSSNCPNPIIPKENEQNTKLLKRQLPRSSLTEKPSPTSPSVSPAISSVHPLSVCPEGLTCEQRYDRLLLFTDTWKSDVLRATSLPAECQEFIQDLYALPLPTSLAGTGSRNSD